MRARKAIRRVLSGRQAGLAPVAYGIYDQEVRRDCYRIVRLLSRLALGRIKKILTGSAR